MDSEAHVTDDSKEKTENEKDSVTVADEAEIWSKLFAKLPSDNEIILEILSRLPLKSIFKFKCVSKNINNTTRQAVFGAMHARNYKATASGGAFTGFFYQSKLIPPQICHYSRVVIDDMDLDEPEFIALEPEENCLPDRSFKFLNQDKDEDVVELLDSCNGLMLCYNYTWTPNFFKTCFLCNPLTRERVALPHPRKRSNRVKYALLADSKRTGYFEYKVVCVYRPKFEDSCSKLLILSSETGEWEDFKERLPNWCHESVMGSKVFFNGSLFWDCLEGHILVCHLYVKRSQRCYELIEAPRAPLGRCLWKFKDKLLCYCHGSPDNFPAWYLSINDKKEFKWKREGCEEFKILTEDICIKYTQDRLTVKKLNPPRIRFKIISYKPESNMIFLWIPDIIYSYELTERRLEFVWGYDIAKFRSPSCVFPYVHSLAPIQTEEIPVQTGMIPEEEQNSNVEVDDYEKLMLQYQNWANNMKTGRKKAASRSSYPK